MRCLRGEKLYYAERSGLMAFASRAEALALEDRYDVRYLAELVANCVPSPELSVYAGVRRVPAGTLAVLEHGRLPSSGTGREPTLSQAEPVPKRSMRPGRSVVASSSTRCGSGSAATGHMGATLRWPGLVVRREPHTVARERGAIADGLAGTVTSADSHGTGTDERKYSDAVVSHWRVRNEAIVDPPFGTTTVARSRGLTSQHFPRVLST